MTAQGPRFLWANDKKVLEGDYGGQYLENPLNCTLEPGGFYSS